MSSIFISRRNVPHDNAWAERIHTWIRDQKGINGFLDFDVQDGLQAGDRWEDEIYAAMNRAQVVIALVSPDWLASDWCMSEARMAKLRGLKLIPLVIAKCAFPFRDIQAIRLEKKGEERAFEELRQALRTTHKLPTQPYPGLVAFEEKDAAVFFAREDETRDLANMLDSLFRGSPETPRLLLVLGASGSGKSSLLRAGLIPEFKAAERRLCIEPVIPRGVPLMKLAGALGITLDGLDDPAAATAILASLENASPGYQRALIPIDQAEELLRGDQGFFFDVLYGYKNHVNVDRKHKLVRRYHVSDAAVHDSQAVDHLLTRGNTGSGVWADAAYRSEEMEKKLRARQLKSHIHRKGQRGKPLTAQAKGSNRTKSRARARVEHIFGAQTNDMGGTLVRTIGMVRAKARIGMKDLAYNMRRLVQLRRINPCPA